MFIPVRPITDIEPRDELFRESRQTPDHPTKLPRRSRIRRMSLLLALAVLGAVGAGTSWYFFGEDREDRNEFVGVSFGTKGAFFDELVNQTQREIEQRYGNAEQEWEGYRPLGSQVPDQLPKGRIKTMLFRGRGGSDNAEGRHSMTGRCAERIFWGSVCLGALTFGVRGGWEASQTETGTGMLAV